MPGVYPTAHRLRGLGDVAAAADTYEEVNRRLREDVGNLQKEIDELRSKDDSRLAPRFIEDIPGKRVPYWWLVNISVDSAITDGGRWSGAATLSQDGPFVINSIRAFWRVTTASAASNGYFLRTFLPPAKLSFLISGTSAAAATSYENAKLVDMPDWFFSVQLAGGGRLWQNSNVPGAVFTTDGVRPEYLGIPGWIERNDTMTVELTASVPSTAPDSTARGTMYFVMSGYKILRPIDYAEAFGLSP